MESILVDLLFALLLVALVLRHVTRTRNRERAARVSASQAALDEAPGPQAQHPHIDLTWCIGCGACVTACPEGDVLAVLGGKAALVQGHRCIGHGLCAEACPVGAIEIVTAPPSTTTDLPVLSAEYESSIPNLFIAGELGGLALIKNAVNQGRDCVDTIAKRLRHSRDPRHADAVDLCVVGAGPAGLSASLRAAEHRLSCVTLEAEEFGGTVARYPRQKLVLTSPVEFPLHGKFNRREISKEELLAFWQAAAAQAGFAVRTRERVEQITPGADGVFSVRTGEGAYRARAVVLAIGRRGTPRKLGVPGEELPKVMYSLLDAATYTGRRILVVGGGDSAVEAAMGLAMQKGNRVTLSYRKAAFSRLKERNARRVQDCIRRGTIEMLFGSEVKEIRPGEVVLRVGHESRRLANEYVWVFAGGTPPNGFLTSIGVQLGCHVLDGSVAQPPAGALVSEPGA